MTDGRPESDADQLRYIADFMDLMDKFWQMVTEQLDIVDVPTNTVDEERGEKLRELFAHDDMQRDLRRIADRLEKLDRGTSDGNDLAH